MKLSQDTVAEKNHVHSYSETQVTLRLYQLQQQVTVSDNFLVMPSEFMTNSAAFQFSTLVKQQYEFLQLAPEVIIFASPNVNSDLQLQASMTQFFNQHQIGVEFMKIGPACRTYNLLLSEDRKALLLVMF
jgi:uncharacterized protein